MAPCMAGCFLGIQLLSLQLSIWLAVNMIAPGPVDTPLIWDSAKAFPNPEEIVQQVACPCCLHCLSCQCVGGEGRPDAAVRPPRGRRKGGSEVLLRRRLDMHLSMRGWQWEYAAHHCSAGLMVAGVVL